MGRIAYYLMIEEVDEERGTRNIGTKEETYYRKESAEAAAKALNDALPPSADHWYVEKTWDPTPTPADAYAAYPESYGTDHGDI